ncbi:hypothetical protein SMCF_2225 [Streptomyces coelicoflavus ZG0656]|nr:hypothetical protein SMCF_2225 [Streptomyces coelicoflavus ZG0656]
MRPGDWPSSVLCLGGTRVSLIMFSGNPGSRHGRQEVRDELPRDVRG